MYTPPSSVGENTLLPNRIHVSFEDLQKTLAVHVDRLNGAV
jgi:hypothetical protein